MIKIIGIIYLAAILFIIMFQVGIIFGKKWGEYTMGGYYKGELPKKLRISAIFSIIILVLIGLIILQEIGLVKQYFHSNSMILVIVFNCLALFLNSITRSKKEKKLWQPITAIMLLFSIIIYMI